ncbi:MAG: class II fructose-bisphosphatase [Synergistaceae bacterium]|nr:class II fructose-bisphosphatase [Synergistaceae bacterium]MBQ9404573.1 class II fructose-bisphosphatase [Synergistaceae bacterium]
MALFAQDKNLAMELVRSAEAAVMASGRWFGLGDKNEVDRAAVEAMRYVLHGVEMKGVVVIGEGEKDEAPMLYNGEEVGTGQGPEMDIAVDPIDGTRLMAQGQDGAISVIAAAPRGSMFSPDNLFYLNKIVTGPEAAGYIDIQAPIEFNVRIVAKAKGKAIHETTVVMLDRPRNNEILAKVRAMGARIRLIGDGDVAGALMTSLPGHETADLLLGIGGSPEAVITACAMKCLDANMQCQPYFRNEEDEAKARERGLTRDTVLTIDDLVKSDNVFFAAAGGSDGDLLRGVHYHGAHIETSSLCMRGSSGTIRFISAVHSQKKLAEMGGNIAYDPSVRENNGL